MNLVLVERSQLSADGAFASLTGRVFEHLQKVLKVAPGDTLRVGLLDGPLGTARVAQCTPSQVVVEIEWGNDSPAPIDVVLVLALPRPKVLRRVLLSATGLGVDQIHVIHSHRVEKSYWSSPRLEPLALREMLWHGLEMAGSTRLPAVHLHRFFKPFVEDLLPGLARGRHGWVAHPPARDPLPGVPESPACLALGPEGGFLPYEIEKFAEAGLRGVRMGARVLNVETAVPAFLSRWVRDPGVADAPA